MDAFNPLNLCCPVTYRYRLSIIRAEFASFFREHLNHEQHAEFQRVGKGIIARDALDIGLRVAIFLENNFAQLLERTRRIW